MGPLLQRGLDWLAAQSDADRAACRELLERCGATGLIDIELERHLTRVGSRTALE